MTALTTADRHTEAAFFDTSLDFANWPVVARFTVEGEPTSKARARFMRAGGKVVTYTPTKTRTAEETMAWNFRATADSRLCRSEGYAYGVVALFFCANRQRRDVDNMVKLVMDSINGLAWHDDSQVLELIARKIFIDGEKQDARTEVLVYRMGELNPPTRVCQECGKRFRTYESWTNKLHCSNDCMLAKRRAARRRTCEHCGEEWDPGKPSKAKYCSRECSTNGRRVILACDHCGDSFDRQRCFIRPTNYCSDECREAAAVPRRLVGSRGVCMDCGGHTSKKKYKRCRACNAKANTRWTNRGETRLR